ncbi:MAG: hypothetical protein KBA02_07135 [Paludibacteraceae bacterium]|nr:hypothetical protein [Paludibacteraceae bacterium]
MRRIALLGSTSHIAKGIIAGLANDPNYSLYCFSRQTGFDSFNDEDYDVVVNCIGTRLLNKQNPFYTTWFTVTEEFDNLIINYLLQHSKDTIYINFSSGAVYGSLSGPATCSSHLNLNPNHLNLSDLHLISKLNAEAKHRCFSSLNIIDIRLFGYFSRHINLNEKYFMSEVINSCKTNTTLEVSPDSWVKDYTSPEDILRIVKYCEPMNLAVDVGSLLPANKFGILDYFKDDYGLTYEIKDNVDKENGTGKRNYYCTLNVSPLPLFKPTHTSLETIKTEAACLL